MTKRCEVRVMSFALLLVILSLGAAARAADFKKGVYSVIGGGVKWSMKFDDSNKVTITRDGQVLVEGTYKVTGDAIEVTDEKGPLACGGDQKTGKYKWKLEEKKLTLTKIEDDCAGRANALTSQTWAQE
jgi:hypothetical protein